MEVKFNDLTEEIRKLYGCRPSDHDYDKWRVWAAGGKRSGKNNDDANALYIAETYKRKYYL